jgi:hypothetical protein
VDPYPVLDDLERMLEPEFVVQRFRSISYIAGVGTSFGALEIQSRPICGWTFVVAPYASKDIVLGYKEEGGSRGGDGVVWLRSYRHEIVNRLGFGKEQRFHNLSIDEVLKDHTVDSELETFQRMARSVDYKVRRAIRPLSVNLILDME